MPKIAIVTDSTAYIPPDLVDTHNLTVTPQILIWGEESYLDGIDILPNEFYSRLESAKVMPTTSQVTPATMKSTFEEIINKDQIVLGIFLSSKLSGTIQSALQAKDMIGKAAERVTIVDSETTAMALGFQALAVARAVEDGASLDEAISLADKTREHTGVYFAVDTLEFLHRGGRIGGAQRFLGTALNMKPVLAVQDGRVEAVERIRTKRKALDRVIEVVSEQVQGKDKIRLATLHANMDAEAKDLLDRAAEQLNPVETIFSEVSPVIGTHAGPGTVGLAYMFGL